MLAVLAPFLPFFIFFVVMVFFVRRGIRRTPPAKRASPKRIHLRRADDVPLKDPAGVEALTRPLLEAGFTDSGLYVIDGLGLVVRFLKGPEDGLYAAIYDRHPAAGTWLDVVTLYEDGTSITV